LLRYYYERSLQPIQQALPRTPHRLEKADARQVFRNRGDPWNRVPGVGQSWRMPRLVALRRNATFDVSLE
jgi:hypothetical protein